MKQLKKSVLAGVAAMTAVAGTQADDIYLIGNSLTWDTKPELLDGAVQHHIDCNKTLPYIYDNPDSFCVPTSTDWSVALASSQYSWISVQPFVQTTLSEDVTVISAWMQMQPSAAVVLHTGWARHASHETAYHGGLPTDEMTYSPEYFDQLCAELSVLHPGRAIVSTDMIGLLDRVYHDIHAGIAPYAALSDLYRDDVHMAIDGQYLAHNAMRRALGQPFSDIGFDTVTPEARQYLRAVIVNCPADITRDGAADVLDLLTYLDLWFAQADLAERTGDDPPDVDVFDLLAFLDYWFERC